MPEAHYAEFASKLAEATAATHSFMTGVRAAARYLIRQHRYTLADIASLTDLHKNSVLKIKDPGWVPKPATLTKLGKLVGEADLRQRGYTGEVEPTNKRGRPRHHRKRMNGR